MFYEWQIHSLKEEGWGKELKQELEKNRFGILAKPVIK
jgi:hypothetical protein